jgi:hypothetical protein
MSTETVKPKKKTLFEEFPDLLELEEGEVADGGPQHALAHYLESLLKWFYRNASRRAGCICLFHPANRAGTKRNI